MTPPPEDRMAEPAAALSADQLLKLLREHHEHHLNAGVIGLKADDEWIEMDNGAEYSDSALYERTAAALAGLPPDEAAPMPRGGIMAHWWQIGILERRKRNDAEQRASALAARLAEVEELCGLLLSEHSVYIWVKSLSDFERSNFTVRALAYLDRLAAERAALAQPEGKRHGG